MSGAPDTPDYGAYADIYARARPSYPDELFAWLASLVAPDVAWDCGTGSGQAARGLAAHVGRVVATDASPRQIARAEPAANIDYRVAPAEAGGLPDASVDLVTAATAMHWFDLPAFYREAERVLRPGGVLAAWTYHGCVIGPPFTALFAHFYDTALRPYFGAEVDLVDQGYSEIALPGRPIEAPSFTLSARWTLPRLLDFVESWSGVRAYRDDRGTDAIDVVRADLEMLWGDPHAARDLEWPLFVRASRMGSADQAGPAGDPG